MLTIDTLCEVFRWKAPEGMRVQLVTGWDRRSVRVFLWVTELPGLPIDSVEILGTEAAGEIGPKLDRAAAALLKPAGLMRHLDAAGDTFETGIASVGRCRCTPDDSR